MTIDLVSQAGETGSFTQHGWRMLLELATAHGWEPAGTEPADISGMFSDDTPAAVVARQSALFRLEWDGGYTDNAFQTVTASDARALADALQRALPYLPSHKSPRIQPSDALPEIDVIVGDVTPHEYYGGPNKTAVVAFIAFARLGEFRIS